MAIYDTDFKKLKKYLTRDEVSYINQDELREELQLLLKILSKIDMVTYTEAKDDKIILEKILFIQTFFINYLDYSFNSSIC